MQDFHDSFYSNLLHKRLEQYFEEVGVLLCLDVIPASGKEFQLNIEIDAKVFDPTHQRISSQAAGYVKLKTKLIG